MVQLSGARDWVNYSNAGQAVEVSLESGEGRGQGRDVIVNIENIVGSQFADRLIGDASVNRIKAGPGPDVVKGKEGDDLLWGNAGGDDLRGGSGHDSATGGSGADHCIAEVLTSC